jgi:hypothetical protein
VWYHDVNYAHRYVNIQWQVLLNRMLSTLKRAWSDFKCSDDSPPMNEHKTVCTRRHNHARAHTRTHALQVRQTQDRKDALSQGCMHALMFATTLSDWERETEELLDRPRMQMGSLRSTVQPAPPVRSMDSQASRTLLLCYENDELQYSRTLMLVHCYDNSTPSYAPLLNQ